MTESQYENQKKEITPAPQIEPIPIPPAPTLAPDLATYLAVLEVLQRPKRYLSSAPTLLQRTSLSRFNSMKTVLLAESIATSTERGGMQH